MPHTLTPPPDLADLATYSARIGADPLLIQAAGGNTSVKDGEVMWIKASGTLLADALTKDIFVPVDLPAMRASLDDPEIDADQPAQFTLGGATLRPSIETSLHAVFDQRVVLHVHCVNTLAHAICADAEAILAPKLAAFKWCFVPYAKPGANLAREVATRLGLRTDVAVLQNHGLLVAAGTVAEAGALLARVVEALTLPETDRVIQRRSQLDPMLRPGWEAADGIPNLHQLAHAPRAAQAAAGSLYPDHVIFCGVAARLVEGDELPDPEGAPPFLIVPGRGVVVRMDASDGARALARCLADVLLRVPAGAPLHYLTEAQNGELLDWDAEKYRQKLNA